MAKSKKKTEAPKPKKRKAVQAPPVVIDPVPALSRIEVSLDEIGEAILGTTGHTLADGLFQVALSLDRIAAALNSKQVVRTIPRREHS